MDANGLLLLVGLALWGILVFGKTNVETTVSGSFSEGSGFHIAEIYKAMDEIHALTARHYAAGKMKVVDGPEAATTALEIALKWVQINDLFALIDDGDPVPSTIPDSQGEILEKVEFWAREAHVIEFDFSGCTTVDEKFAVAGVRLEEEFRALHERHGKF